MSGQSPVVDVTNTTVATRYDTELLASLPGARDYWAVLAQTPAVSMGRVDVGGSGALTQQPYTAYGLDQRRGSQPRRGRRHHGQRGRRRRRQRHVLHRLRRLRRDRHQRRGQRRRDAQSRRPQPADREIRRQPVSRQRLLRLSERVDGGDQHRRRADCRRRHRQRRRRSARHQPPRDVPRLQRRSRRVRPEGPPLVVRRDPAHRHRPALSHAARRHPGHVGPGRHRQGDLECRRRTTS